MKLRIYTLKILAIMVIVKTLGKDFMMNLIDLQSMENPTEILSVQISNLRLINTEERDHCDIGMHLFKHFC